MLPEELYTTEQCRELELLAINSGTGGYELMCRAGAAALDLLLEAWPDAEHLHVVCAGGNNGGDGLVLARLALERQLPVTVYWLGQSDRLPLEAKSAYEDAVSKSVNMVPFDDKVVLTAGIIVDALLGAGLKGLVKGNIAQAIHWINQQQLPVLALDSPSGLCADTGTVLGVAVKATRTISFIAAKRGHFTADAMDYTGMISVSDLMLPREFFEKVDSPVAVLNMEKLLQALPARQKNSHKGKFGHVLVIGGNTGMAGAPFLAAASALRCGAGLVSIATLPEHVNALSGLQPEIMIHGISQIADIDTLLHKATVVVIGPGLGIDEWASLLLQKALSISKVLVMDADALNVLPPSQIFKPVIAQWRVFTPHPGEAARLSGKDINYIQSDRFNAAHELGNKFNSTVILKGAGTVIAHGNGLSLCAAGNPGMSSAGMGDVLSGVVGGLLAQGMGVDDAAKLATVVHANAADILAREYGPRGMLASDLIPVMRRLINGM